ncbi:hypothetical protein FB451DRAFT_1394567 [Mycena latifolia]|nr:hypothetical protein FB451DRAFT_1394567 [Mycena latifolia]
MLATVLDSDFQKGEIGLNPYRGERYPIIIPTFHFFLPAAIDSAWAVLPSTRIALTAAGTIHLEDEDDDDEPPPLESTPHDGTPTPVCCCRHCTICYPPSLRAKL